MYRCVYFCFVFKHRYYEIAFITQPETTHNTNLFGQTPKCNGYSFSYEKLVKKYLVCSKGGNCSESNKSGKSRFSTLA